MGTIVPPDRCLENQRELVCGPGEFIQLGVLAGAEWDIFIEMPSQL